MSKDELSFLEWLSKINERTTLILLSIKDRRDISEEDWELLRCLHRQYYLGELPFYRNKFTLTAETATQTNFLCHFGTESGKGTKIDNRLSE